MSKWIFNAILAAVGSLMSMGAVHAAPATYTMDPGHTVVLATWDHFGFSKPSAMFDQVSGTITYDPEHPEKSSVEASIPVASLHTSSDKLDEHLQEGDFFDVKKWPDVTFRSTRVEPGASEGTLAVTGDLSIHGQTHPITLHVTVNKLGTRPGREARIAGFNATASLKRSDFGVSLYAPMVSDQVEISITTEAVESKAWQAMQKK